MNLANLASRKSVSRILILAGALALPTFGADVRAAATFETLYSFPADDTRGASPLGSMVQDASGALYGITANGGKMRKCMGGCGVVYKLTPTKTGPWRQTIVHAFANTDGEYPNDGLTLGPDGTIYGTTSYGGSLGGGTVFSLTPPAPGHTNWTHMILHEFDANSTNNYAQYGKVIPGTDGALYGMNGAAGSDKGTIWQLTKTKSGWRYKSIYHLNGGLNPQNGLVQDAQGRLYGTGSNGGAGDVGVLFRLSPPAMEGGEWSFHIIHEFSMDPADASYPGGQLALRNGVLYGQADSNVAGEGSVMFRVTLPNSFEIFYRGDEATQGNFGGAGITLDSDGTIYAVNQQKGPSNAGTLFKLMPPPSGDKWRFRMLHVFTGQPDGNFPYTQPLLDKDGNVYVNTETGGADNQGGVFVYRP
jgi:uncharacterized repeat protein (TIGR03803 family)